MTYAARLLLFTAASWAVHLLLARGMERIPAQRPADRPAVVEVQIREPPPEPAPTAREIEKEPEPEPEPRRQPLRRAQEPRLHQTVRAAQREPEKEVPPTERPDATGDATDTPVYGISMESTSAGGTGPTVPVGNTLQGTPNKKASGGKVKPLAAPAPAYEVSKMPLPQGRCSGKYTEQARQAGIEGTVVLDLVVGEDGRTREITIVQGLGHGLDGAAITALKNCRFSPGERGGRPVPVRLRGFKIRFFLKGTD